MRLALLIIPLIIPLIITILLPILWVPNVQADHVEQCSIVSGCPTGDAALGINFTGLQPADLSKGAFKVTATGTSSTTFSCTYPGGHATRTASCNAFYNSSATNIECLIEHLDCRNNPFDISVSAPAGYSCSPDPNSVSLNNCANNTPIAVNCTPPCTPTTCNAAEPACGQTTTGTNNCGGSCTKTGPACPQTFTIGGKMTRSDTGAGISGVTINQEVTSPPSCNIGTANTDTQGNYSFTNVAKDLSFCLRPPAVTGLTGPNPTSFENQTATANKTDYNFSYTPKVPTLAVQCSVSPTTADTGQNVTWVVDLQGGISPFSYSWNFGADYTCVSPTSGCTTSQNPTVKYNSAGTRSGSVAITDSSSPQQTKTSTNTCQVTITAPPAFDFNLTNGGDKTVARGSAVNNSVGVNLVSGSTESVSLTASGFPSGVTHSFSPTSCNPTCSSTLNMTASQTATTSSPTITVTGTAGSLTKTTTFILTVTIPPATCGDGTCGAGETCSTCSADCGTCPAPPPPPPLPTPPPRTGPNCAWIQTTGGDVHSNTAIDTPCGP